ncbi:hypothetical protein [Streptomyces griseoflavus]|uniref:hypothetical protein n=1 Tax=Streptomyces griseoflavus TaxID=35619 RepID=UPI003D70E14C
MGGAPIVAHCQEQILGTAYSDDLVVFLEADGDAATCAFVHDRRSTYGTSRASARAGSQ